VVIGEECRKLRVTSPLPCEPVQSPEPQSRGRSRTLSTRTFTATQANLVNSVLAEASEILGADARTLPMLDPARVGLLAPITFGEAYKQLKGGASVQHLSAYIRAVLALKDDERVQGRELR
jgi:hypothetical protein